MTRILTYYRQRPCGRDSTPCPECSVAYKASVEDKVFCLRSAPSMLCSKPYRSKSCEACQANVAFQVRFNHPEYLFPQPWSDWIYLLLPTDDLLTGICRGTVLIDDGNEVVCAWSSGIHEAVWGETTFGSLLTLATIRTQTGGYIQSLLWTMNNFGSGFLPYYNWQDRNYDNSCDIGDLAWIPKFTPGACIISDIPPYPPPEITQIEIPK